MGKYVYVMKSGKDTYKIGVSSNPHERLRSVQTGCTDKVELVFTYFTDNPFYYEKLVHGLFKDNRVIGEWFKFKSKAFIGIIVEQLTKDEIVEPSSRVNLITSPDNLLVDYIKNKRVVQVRDIPRSSGQSDVVIAKELLFMGCVKKRLSNGQFWITPLGLTHKDDNKMPKELNYIYKSCFNKC